MSFLVPFQDEPDTTHIEVLFCTTAARLPLLLPPMSLTEELFTAWDSCAQMISVLVLAATFLPQVLNAMGLPAATFLEEKDDATGLNTCTVSLYFANDCGRFNDLRTFTASSLDGITNAKHLASLDAIQNLKSKYNFTIVDVSSKELSELKSAQPLPPLVKKIKALSLSNAPESPSASAPAPTLNSGRPPTSKKRNKSIAFSSGGVDLQTGMSEQLECNNQLKNRFFLLARTFATTFQRG